MDRTEFLKKVMRYLLFGILAFIAAATGSKVVTEVNCLSCPGKGICSGESDCSTFLSDHDGRAKK
jgi:hypothetical protein